MTGFMWCVFGLIAVPAVCFIILFPVLVIFLAIGGFASAAGVASGQHSKTEE